MIRARLRWITLLPGRKALLLDVRGRLWRGRVRFVGIGVVGISLDKPAGWMLREIDFVPGGVAARSRVDEGISWCRGWEGQDADAFRAAHALAS